MRPPREKRVKCWLEGEEVIEIKRKTVISSPCIYKVYTSDLIAFLLHFFTNYTGMNIALGFGSRVVEIPSEIPEPSPLVNSVCP